VLGPITLDPASEADANAVIGADHYYTKEDDGLSKPWAETIWLNPPGGKMPGSRRSLPQLFWIKLMETLASGHLRHALFLCFSSEQLQNTQGLGVPGCIDFPFCIPSKRIQFSGAASPTHANAIIYVAGRANMTGAFITEFAKLGRVVVP